MIIGKLIPAGTGIARYRNVEVNPTEEARAAAFSMAGYDESDYYGFGNANATLGPGGAARRLRLRRLPVAAAAIGDGGARLASIPSPMCVCRFGRDPDW